MPTDETSTPKSGLLPWLAAHHSAAGAGIMVAGVAIAVLPTILAAWYHTDFVGTVVTTGLLALLVIGVGVMLRFLPDDAAARPDQILGLVLALGGIGGLLIALTGVALTVHWSTLLTDWLREGKREGAAWVLLAFATFVVGLFVMFVTLQLGRAEEHRNPAIRRLTYGYNAVFGGVLLLLILAVVNVLMGIKVAWAIDATSSREYSLSERTVNLVKGLDRPLHLYVIWPHDDTRLPIEALLEGLQSRSPQVQVEYVSPALNPERVNQLDRAYPRKIESVGILLVYGDEKPENATFLKQSDLFEEGMGNTPTRFRGEDKIDAALSGLESGGQKTIVYVTQGSGEPSLTDSGMRPAPGSRGGLGTLKERLTARGNFDIRPFTISAASVKVPDDCKVLVVPAPKPPVDPRFEQAVRQYLEKNGKVVFLFDVPAPATGPKMPATGFEGLLAGYNVEVTGDRILSFGAIAIGGARALTDRVIVEVNPALAESHANEVATTFAGYPFLLNDVRLVRPSAGGRPAGSLTQALLTTVAGRDVWTESDWQADPTPQYTALRRDDANMLKRVAKEPLPAALVVTAAGKPKLAVFGDVTFITNPSVSERSSSQNFSFFASLLDWLGERPTSIGIEPRNLAVYAMEPTARFSNLALLPGLMAVVVILGLGLGVWVVRRR